ncbi:uncharacterized protein [Aegilops tauschii subsp. strangulata]|uniref:uncharacterized protein n=1 Tax=Aegilops tauschii subsp. strangulata TaxID=200361 RepID=UPI00098B3DA0
MQRTRPASALPVSLSAVEQRRQCGTQRLGRSDGFLRRGRRALASLPTSSSYSSSVALVSSVEPAGAEGMRTEVAQIRAVTTTGAPHPLHVPLPNPPLPPWPAARDPNHIRGSSHGPPSLFPCCRSTGSEAEGPGAGGSRWVLGDIGNIVPAHVLEGNIQLPTGITPITRSFSAEL